jgi:fibronectin type 3 domain-containing protein
MIINSAHPSLASAAARRRFPVRLSMIVLIVSVLACSTLAHASDNAVALRLKAKYDGTRILLRWAPSDMNFDYTYKLFTKVDGKETLSGTYNKVALEKIAKEYSPETAHLLTALLYPQSLYKTDTQKLEAISQKDNQKGMAFFLAELNIEPGKTYTYVLRAYENGKEMAAQTVVISTSKPTVLYPPTVTVRRYDWGCALRWTHFDAYTAFHVYRASGKKTAFEKITKTPVSVSAIRKDNGLVETPPYFYSDTTTEKNQAVYYYKVTGIDSFGDESPLSAESFAIRDASLRPAPQMPVATEIIEPFIKISWTNDPASSVTGVNIYRASLYNGNYEKLNHDPITAPSYTDKTAQYNVNYFYCHTAIDAKGTESVMSLPQLAVLRDRTPPAAPRDLKAVAEKGAIHLFWLPVADPDVSGYELYRASSRDALDWAMLTKGDYTADRFTDTMAALLDKKPYYYKVLAKDKNANRSAFSNIIEIKLPDVTPPSPPVWKGSKFENHAVILEWRASSTRDIKGYRLYKGLGNKRVKVADLSGNLLTYTDQNLTPGANVWYFLTAVDTDQNESELSSGLEIKHKDLTAVSLNNLSIKTTENGIMIMLNAQGTDFSSMTVKRKRSTQTQFKTIVSNHRMDSFLDKYVDKNKSYLYKVMAYDKSGNVATSPEILVMSK